MSTHLKHGWLMYAGTLGLITGEVISADISFHVSMMDVTSFASSLNSVQQVRGPADVSFSAQMTDKIQWDKDPRGVEPPNLNALLMLSRRYPEEYRRLCEAESVLKALGG